MSNEAALWRELRARFDVFCLSGNDICSKLDRVFSDIEVEYYDLIQLHEAYQEECSNRKLLLSKELEELQNELPQRESEDDKAPIAEALGKKMEAYGILTVEERESEDELGALKREFVSFEEMKDSFNRFRRIFQQGDSGDNPNAPKGSISKKASRAADALDAYNEMDIASDSAKATLSGDTATASNNLASTDSDSGDDGDDLIDPRSFDPASFETLSPEEEFDLMFGSQSCENDLPSAEYVLDVVSNRLIEHIENSSMPFEKKQEEIHGIELERMMEDRELLLSGSESDGGRDKETSDVRQKVKRR